MRSRVRPSKPLTFHLPRPAALHPLPVPLARLPRPNARITCAGMRTVDIPMVIRAQDGRRFRAKVNPRGRGYIDGPELLVGEKGREFVANADAVNNPHIRPVFDIIDQAQRRGTVGRLNMRTIARSLVIWHGATPPADIPARTAAVSFTGITARCWPSWGRSTMIFYNSRKLIRTDHRAYVVLSDLNAMQQKLDAAKNLARL